MLVKRLKLNNYRNYERLEIAPSPGINVICGENAQGKTNAVEAVFLCAFSKSHRTFRDAELIMQNRAGGYVGLELENQSGGHLIEMKLRDGLHKQMFIDRQLCSKTGELMGILNVVMFSPEDLALVKSGPAERRRFMDMELCQMRPSYYYRLQQYNRALKQRNAVLKELMLSGAALKSEAAISLSVWDEQLGSLGEGLINARCEFLDELSTVARDIHLGISGGERLNVYYQPDVDIEHPGGVYAALTEALYRSRQEDIRRGFTTAGPHRDDIGVKLDETDIRIFGSQGQQRTAALSMKLSELALIRSLRGEAPVLLLDDVLSELDDNRQRMLLESTKNCQCFLTCTSMAGIERASLTSVARVYRCRGGALDIV